MANVVDLEKLLPDCGYKLRSVSIQALGRIEAIDCDDCDDGESSVLNVVGGGSSLELDDFDEETSGLIRLKGDVLPPFDGHLTLSVEDWQPASRP